MTSSIITQYFVGGYDDNLSYIIWDHEGRRCALVDPCGDVSATVGAINDSGYELIYTYITHTHADHIDGLKSVVETFPNVIIVAHQKARKQITYSNTMFVDDGDVMTIGDVRILVIYTPGHTDDSVCYLVSSDSGNGHDKLVTGDTLFVEGCGITSREDASSLYSSLQLLKEMGDNAEVYPGHDYGSKSVSTLGWEKFHNRFLLAQQYDDFLTERFPG